MHATGLIERVLALVVGTLSAARTDRDGRRSTIPGPLPDRGKGPGAASVRTHFEEIPEYVRCPYTAWEHALTLGHHHPRLWNLVRRSPFEALYRERFDPPEETKVMG